MRILVTVASKHGATAEMAEWMGAALVDAGADVTVATPETLTSLDGYDAVILGSAVYAGHWLEPAKAFALRFAPELTAGRTWIFSSGPVGSPLKPDEAPVDIAEMLPLTGAREHRVFGGRIHKHGMGFAERAMLTALRVPDGDFRPQDEVVQWAKNVAAVVSRELASLVAARD